MARMMVTTAPIPSGMAATATATADMTLCKKLTRRESNPPKNKIAATESTVTVMIFPRRETVLSSGVGTGLEEDKSPAIFPISVSIPVAITTHRARPRMTKVDI